MNGDSHNTEPRAYPAGASSLAANERVFDRQLDKVPDALLSSARADVFRDCADISNDEEDGSTKQQRTLGPVIIEHLDTLEQQQRLGVRPRVGSTIYKPPMSTVDLVKS